MPKKPKIAVYPGTFDPITNGHLDIMMRSLPLVDHLIIAVAENLDKNPLFSLSERIEIIHHEITQSTSLVKDAGINLEIQGFDQLLVKFAQNMGAQMIIRGLRAVSDFEYEFQMASVNEKLAPEIETVLLMASDRYQFISSRFVKEVARLGGDVSHFVSPYVHQKLRERFSRPF